MWGRAPVVDACLCVKCVCLFGWSVSLSGRGGSVFVIVVANESVTVFGDSPAMERSLRSMSCVVLSVLYYLFQRRIGCTSRSAASSSVWTCSLMRPVRHWSVMRYGFELIECDRHLINFIIICWVLSISVGISSVIGVDALKY